jgi:hypothetical protein
MDSNQNGWRPPVQGSLSSFASSNMSSMNGRASSHRDDSYHLLLELCSHEPTMQACFKVIESTCLARGIDVVIKGKPPSSDFRMFMARCVIFVHHSPAHWR